MTYFRCFPVHGIQQFDWKRVLGANLANFHRTSRTFVFIDNKIFVPFQRAYPPTHYIRRVPQRVVHQFTIIEFIQLVILVAIGFAQYHYVEMVFPIVIAAFIPFRYTFFIITTSTRTFSDTSSFRCSSESNI